MSTLDDWLDKLAAALHLDPGDIDRDGVLDLTRDVAHNVARPAAPLTAFVVGLAAGKAGGDSDSIRRAIDTAAQLASSRSNP